MTLEDVCAWGMVLVALAFVLLFLVGLVDLVL